MDTTTATEKDLLRIAYTAKDPRKRLEALDALRARLAQVERGAVLALKLAGATWSEIGALRGTTRQAAQQRYGAPQAPRTSPGRKKRP